MLREQDSTAEDTSTIVFEDVHDELQQAEVRCGDCGWITVKVDSPDTLTTPTPEPDFETKLRRSEMREDAGVWH
ncbi:unnamed protein product [Dibothriocephalus latus]|uniref:Uncharacterized protein n=1 Tax=Dibothriocephalus latus TaxID=60516 RepID=A0A3P6SW40_DIBLA|nr:unnamed protein product [Dibothriocephalus latus]